MNETEWLACTDPLPMLDFLRGHATARKLRLFGLARCCRILRLLTDQRSVNVILVADRYLDGMASREEFHQARITARGAFHDVSQPAHAAFVPAWLEVKDPYSAAKNSSSFAASAVGHELAASGGSKAEVHEKYIVGRARESKHQAALLRHIIGNPFRLHPAVAHWTTTIVQLADALYNGQDCAFALNDALLDSGLSDLADHIRQEQRHPKGCWVLDLILGKE